MNVIELGDVHKSFGDHKAVSGVSLSVAHGSIHGLIGRNGAGKTTTIRMIMGIYAPDAGSLRFNGSEIDPGFRDRVGYLPEERGLYPKMAVGDALAFFARIKLADPRTAADRIRTMLERFGLAGREADRIDTLSKGNQQKVQFIAAVAHDPDLVILDEPFSGLDPVNTALMTRMIEELRDEGKAILFSTHIMEFAERLCDHITLIDQGRVLLTGSPAAIKQAHTNNEVAIVTADDTAFVNELPGVLSSEQNGATLRVTLDAASDPQTLLRHLVERGVSLARFDATPASLHDIFVARTGRGDEAPTAGSQS